MHLKLAEYCFNLENKNYDEAIKVLDDNFNIIVNNLKGTHPTISIKQYEIILNLLKYNAMMLRDINTNIKINDYINIDDINLAVFNSESYMKDLLGVSLALYCYNQDKDYDYSNLEAPLIRHINYLNLLINRYILVGRINQFMHNWANNFENQTGIVYDNLHKNISELITRYLLRSEHTQY